MAKRLTAADWWTVSRVVLAAAALGVTALSPEAHLNGVARWWVIALLALGAVTDVIDGWWARRTGTSSARGAMWDGRADQLLAVAAGIALAVFVEWTPVALWAVVAVFLGRVVVAAIAHARVGVAIDHTVANKVAGATAMVAVLTALSVGTVENTVVAVVLCVALAAALWATIADARASFASNA